MMRLPRAVGTAVSSHGPRETTSMQIDFEHRPHPRIAERKKAGPPKTTDEHVGFNGRVAIIVTGVVGTMWCAYAFAILALVALPSALKSGDPLQLVQWISQTFIQLVLLSVIIVGQNISSRASDKRAEMTYKDAEATFHEAQQIQAHLKSQDDALNAMLDKIEKLEAARGAA
jgi:hypothetical protein